MRVAEVTCLEIYILHMLEDERWRLRSWVADHIKQLNDIRATAEILKNLDLTLDLLLLHRLQDLWREKEETNEIKRVSIASLHALSVPSRLALLSLLFFSF